MKRLITLMLVLPIVNYSPAQSYSVGSNIMALVTGSLNLELSASLNRRLSLHLPLSWNPLQFGDNKKIKHKMFDFFVILRGSRGGIYPEYGA